MTKHLYLLESQARYNYVCAGCGVVIPRGSSYFRHDPFPMARIHRQERTTHWCYRCVTSTDANRDRITGRIRVPIVQVLSPEAGRARTIALARVELLGVGRPIAELLASDPSHIYSLTPEQFEEFICDRLYAMGFEPRRVGETFQKDGGLDIIFWPRATIPFPMLGAAQVRHHRRPTTKEGVASVRDLAGTIAGHPFNVGVLITNTTFTADAEWFAREKARLLRLRGFSDIKRWLNDNFADSEEWREFPDVIEVCPGVVVPIRSRSGLMSNGSAVDLKSSEKD
jgi:hypothetical protein